ncbi:PEP-CTERM-box response regulator transcription factor [candidate division GN15 bacterium]|nr:PEP-CTERM-box response regulator transcription factor [candidate division GN15 bacterium]
MDTNRTILIVDDEKGIRQQMYFALKGDYDVLQAEDSQSAMKQVQEGRPAVVCLDLSLTGAEDEREGLDLIGRFLEIDPALKIIMVTAHGQKENALLCIERGAYDFFSKPVDITELKVVINRALYLYQLEREKQDLQDELQTRDRFDGIIGSSEIMHQVFNLIKSVSATDYTVLVTGESGTGKELVARSIHRQSPRSDQPFVPINCGAIPENLLESELFGYEKGAFTDARQQKIGRLEQANGGTVFLDEIGELSLPLQVKLLRFIEDRRIERVGGSQQITLNVRIIAATNRKLDQEVAAGKFREDLYYRLSVLQIELPPLRDRGEDLLYLARYFLERFGEDQGRKGLTLSAQAIEAVSDHKWPGNVRELENKIKRAVILCQGQNVSAADLALAAPAGEQEPSDELSTLQQVKERAEREHLVKALVSENWNISRVARRLEVSRTTLYELMDKYNLRRSEKA